MNNQFSPEQLAQLKAQFETVDAFGVSPKQLLGVIDNIINGDLSDKDYKIPNDASLVDTKDKQKEAGRIINNYSIALSSLTADQKAGKDDDMKTIVKFTIIASAAKTALSALGMGANMINDVLGLSGY